MGIHIYIAERKKECAFRDSFNDDYLQPMQDDQNPWYGCVEKEVDSLICLFVCLYKRFCDTIKNQMGK